MLDARPDQLVLGQSEVRRANPVADANRAVGIDGEQRLGDAVEDGLNRRRRRDRLGDGLLHPVVVRIDQAQQFDEIRRVAVGSLCHLPDFVAQVLAHTAIAPVYAVVGAQIRLNWRRLFTSPK